MQRPLLGCVYGGTQPTHTYVQRRLQAHTDQVPGHDYTSPGRHAEGDHDVARHTRTQDLRAQVYGADHGVRLCTAARIR